MKLALHTGFRAAQKAIAAKPATLAPRSVLSTSEGVPDYASGRRAKEIKGPKPFSGKTAALFAAKVKRY